VSGISIETIIWLVLLLPSITFHEYMHGYAAHRLGDDTAKNAGRLTLNPLAHIDPFGTVVLPLLLLVSGSPIFGYAKPVPVNPGNFADIRRGDLITGLAGPAANLVLAFLGAGLAWLAVGMATVSGSLAWWVYIVGATLVTTNLVLMFFNLIPIPPLDGSSIITIFLPERWLPRWYELQRYSFALIFVLLFVLPMLTQMSPLGWYFSATVDPLTKLLLPG
jgi:Zn-dependent protease